MRKTVLIQFLLAELLLAFSVPASATPPGETPLMMQQLYSVKISGDDLKVQSAADMISAQIGIAFSYSEEVGNVPIGQVNVSLNNAKLETILSSVFSDAGSRRKIHRGCQHQSQFMIGMISSQFGPAGSRKDKFGLCSVYFFESGTYGFFRSFRLHVPKYLL